LPEQYFGTDTSVVNFPDTMTTSAAYTGSVTSHSVYLYKFTLKNNVFTENFSSNGRATVDIRGSPRVFISGNTWTKNGDAFKEVVNDFSNGDMGENGDKDLADIVSDGDAPETLSKGLLYVSQAL